MNTTIDVNYFFKAYMWNENPFIMEMLVVSDNSFYYYTSNNKEEKPILMEQQPITRGQRNKIKKYLSEYPDLNSTYCNKNYINYGPDKLCYEVKMGFKGQFRKKKIKGDTATPKLINSILKILSEEELGTGDYIDAKSYMPFNKLSIEVNKETDTNVNS